MYFCIKQQLNGLTKEEYLTLRELCHIAKNVYNVGLYNVRQYYFEHKEFLNYEKNDHLAKTNENYKLLNSNMAQQILKKVNEAFKSFFGLISLAKQGKYDHKAISIPKYLKKDGFHSLIIGQIRIDGNKFTIPYSRLFKKTHKPITITIPPVLLDKKIKQIEIIPKHHARFFEIQYKYEMPEDQRELNDQKALAIDLGLNNLATCVTSDGRSFIIDGRRLKSINQWFNKENARLQSIKDKQKIKGTTRKQDVNGALNILKKSKAVDLSVLCSSGEVDTPQRIRIA